MGLWVHIRSSLTKHLMSTANIYKRVVVVFGCWGRGWRGGGGGGGRWGGVGNVLSGKYSYYFLKYMLWVLIIRALERHF